jgi:tetratricopeptide (TPR) repeat protein
MVQKQQVRGQQKKATAIKASGNKMPVNKDRKIQHRLFFWIGLIIVASFLVFSPGLKNELVSWDDYNYIRDNIWIRSLSWDNILHLFHYKTFIMGNYHPLTILSYAIEYKMAGSSPFLYHFDNILLHLVNIALFAWMMWLLTKKSYATIIAAALFAVHPMRVESVVWAAERKDVLYTFFYLLASISYIFYLTKTILRPRYYLFALLLFLFSILSKGQAVVLPLTFILIDYWYQKKINLRSLADKIPFFAIALIFGILAILAQSSSLTSQRLVSYPVYERFLFAAYNITAYLYKLIFPYNLACFYGYPPPDRMGIIYISSLVTVIILTVVFLRFKNNQTILFGSLFFLATIFIVVQVLPIGNAIVADRYTYIPYIGLFFIIGMLLDKLLTGNPKLRVTVISLSAVQFIVFAGASYLQSETWQNNETLWNRALKNNPEEGMCYNNLAVNYMDKKEYDKALDLLQKSILYKQTFTEVYRAYSNIGKIYSETGKETDAIKYFSTAVEIAPGFQDGYFNRGLSYTTIGKYDAAIADFTTIIKKLKPDHAESYYSRAIAYNKKSMSDSAISDYTRAIEIKPGYGEAYTNRGNIYFNRGNYDEAIANYIMALKYTPDDGNTLLNRSFSYFKKQAYPAALADAEKAISLSIPVNSAYMKDLKTKISPNK